MTSKYNFCQYEINEAREFLWQVKKARLFLPAEKQWSDENDQALGMEYLWNLKAKHNHECLTSEIKYKISHDRLAKYPETFSETNISQFDLYRYTKLLPSFITKLNFHLSFKNYKEFPEYYFYNIHDGGRMVRRITKKTPMLIKYDYVLEELKNKIERDGDYFYLNKKRWRFFLI